MATGIVVDVWKLLFHLIAHIRSDCDIRGCSGDVEELVTAYLEGNVKDNGEACDHHDCH